ncbi:Hypothetical_protein [Hexamita inflata]|uniref:Hypothetical_protein n=1 Tax=Hexamita inflata TaxID=28002 RepID=A0AA86N7Z4_9EUKA|nr:Hypothetical protein HINF_LOCUS2021 [Hexamita inflata]
MNYNPFELTISSFIPQDKDILQVEQLIDQNLDEIQQIVKEFQLSFSSSTNQISQCILRKVQPIEQVNDKHQIQVEQTCSESSESDHYFQNMVLMRKSVDYSIFDAGVNILDLSKFQSFLSEFARAEYMFQLEIISHFEKVPLKQNTLNSIFIKHVLLFTLHQDQTHFEILLDIIKLQLNSESIIFPLIMHFEYKMNAKILTALFLVNQLPEFVFKGEFLSEEQFFTVYKNVKPENETIIQLCVKTLINNGQTSFISKMNEPVYSTDQYSNSIVMCYVLLHSNIEHKIQALNKLNGIKIEDCTCGQKYYLKCSHGNVVQAAPDVYQCIKQIFDEGLTEEANIVQTQVMSLPDQKQYASYIIALKYCKQLNITEEIIQEALKRFKQSNVAQKKTIVEFLISQNHADVIYYIEDSSVQVVDLLVSKIVNIDSNAFTSDHRFYFMIYCSQNAFLKQGKHFEQCGKLFVKLCKTTTVLQNSQEYGLASYVLNQFLLLEGEIDNLDVVELKDEELAEYVQNPNYQSPKIAQMVFASLVLSLDKSYVDKLENKQVFIKNLLILIQFELLSNPKSTITLQHVNVLYLFSNNPSVVHLIQQLIRLAMSQHNLPILSKLVDIFTSQPHTESSDQFSIELLKIDDQLILYKISQFISQSTRQDLPILKAKTEKWIQIQAEPKERKLILAVHRGLFPEKFDLFQDQAEIAFSLIQDVTLDSPEQLVKLISASQPERVTVHIINLISTALSQLDRTSVTIYNSQLSKVTRFASYLNPLLVPNNPEAVNLAIKLVSNGLILPKVAVSLSIQLLLSTKSASNAARLLKLSVARFGPRLCSGQFKSALSQLTTFDCDLMNVQLLFRLLCVNSQSFDVLIKQFCAEFVNKRRKFFKIVGCFLPFQEFPGSFEQFKELLEDLGEIEYMSELTDVFGSGKWNIKGILKLVGDVQGE